jgi:hypothetical protein
MSIVSSSVTGEARGSFSQFSASAGANSHIPKKRPRPVLSCIECRKKKLKCNRLLPCSQCTRADKIPQCVYRNRETSQTQSQLVSDGSESELGPSRKKIRGAQTAISLATRDSAPDQLSVPLIGQNEKSGVLENLQSRVERLERILSGNPQSHTEAVSKESSRPSQVCSSFYISFSACVGPSPNLTESCI